jgi:hypothetical protein
MHNNDVNACAAAAHTISNIHIDPDGHRATQKRAAADFHIGSTRISREQYRDAASSSNSVSGCTEVPRLRGNIRLSAVSYHCTSADCDVRHLKSGDGAAPRRAWLRWIRRTAGQTTAVGRVGSEVAVLDVEEQVTAGTCHRHCAAAGCAAVDEAALRHHYTACAGGHGATVGGRVGAALKGDARDGDGGVDDAESCACGHQAAAAFEDGGRRHAADDERRNVANVDRGLIERTGTQGNERSANALHSVRNSFAGRRHDACGRVGAVHGVDGD